MNVKLLMAALICSLLIGCATGEATRTSTTQYAATDPKKVDILLEKPERAYEVVGFVSAKGGQMLSQSDIFEKMKEEAATLGANAVLIRSDVQEDVNYFTGEAWKKGNALAIRWK